MKTSSHSTNHLSSSHSFKVLNCNLSEIINISIHNIPNEYEPSSVIVHHWIYLKKNGLSKKTRGFSPLLLDEIGQSLFLMPQKSWASSWCSFCKDLKFVSVRVDGSLVWYNLLVFLFVFVFIYTSFGFVLPLDITPLFWFLACLDMTKVLWGWQPS